MKTVQIDGVEYEEVRPEAVLASKVVSDMWVRLGRPQDPFTESGKKLMDIIIAVWEDCYPIDRNEWYSARDIYKKEEMSIRDQVKQQTGRSLASYPYPIFAMMKAVFKKFDPAERNNCIKMVKLWPMFQFANKV